MTRHFRPLALSDAPEMAPCVQPLQHFHDVSVDHPALSLMIDFRDNPPPQLGPSETLTSALDKMRFAHTAFLLVTAEHGEVLGLLSRDDLETERPMQQAQLGQYRMSELTVADVMIPRHQVTALDVEDVSNARVGDVLLTLHELETPFALVTSRQARRQVMRGLFSAYLMAEKLENLGDEDTIAPNFARLSRRLDGLRTTM